MITNSSRKINYLRSHDEAEKESSFAWLLTFSDLLLLLLSLFVLRLSMASIPLESLPQNHGSQHSMGNIESQTQALVPIDPQIAPGSQSDKTWLSSMHLRTKDGVTLSASLGPESFLEGSDELTFAGAEALQTIALSIKSSDYKVHIEVHTKPSSLLLDSIFASSWDLSQARVIAVLRQFIDAGVEAQSLFVTHFGDSKAKIFQKEAKEGVMNLEPSERVDITIGSLDALSRKKLGIRKRTDNTGSDAWWNRYFP